MQLFFADLSRDDYARAVAYVDLSAVGGPAPGEPGFDAFVTSFTSSLPGATGSYSSDVGAVLTADGWKIDPFSIG